MSQQKTERISEKMTRLEKLVEWFKGDDFVLEQATEKLLQAQELAVSVENDLLVLRNTVTVLREKFEEE